jgi:hypothetical protein
MSELSALVSVFDLIIVGDEEGTYVAGPVILMLQQRCWPIAVFKEKGIEGRNIKKRKRRVATFVLRRLSVVCQT